MPLWEILVPRVARVARVARVVKGIEVPRVRGAVPVQKVLLARKVLKVRKGE